MPRKQEREQAWYCHLSRETGSCNLEYILSQWTGQHSTAYSVNYFAHLSQGVSPVIQLELLWSWSWKKSQHRYVRIKIRCQGAGVFIGITGIVEVVAAVNTIAWRTFFCTLLSAHNHLLLTHCYHLDISGQRLWHHICSPLAVEALVPL